MYLFHFGAFNAQNAGDTILGQATEDLIDRDAYWGRYHIYEGIPPDKLIQHINDKVDAVVIGGGGFIIPTFTKAAEISGWHCPLSLEQIKRIERPIICFGLGYNKFWGKTKFNELFKPNINELVRRSIFFGLRNHGSIEQLTPYIEPDLVHKLTYQPDPASLLLNLYPEYENTLPRYNELAFQVALDSLGVRFSKSEVVIQKTLKEIRRAIIELSHNHDIKVVLHGVYDAQKKHLSDLYGGLDVKRYPFVKLFFKPIHVIMDYYAGCPLTVAMRGHGQLIPFGLGNPFVSLVSHPKQEYFLKDVGLNSSVRVREKNLSDRIIELVETLDDKSFREKIKVEREKLWQITQQNLTKIKTALKK